MPIYQNGSNYTLSTLEFGPLEPNGVDAVPYAEKLMGGNGVSYEEVDISETPDGEYVVLSFPDDDIRFDFFRIDDGKNYVRTVWGGESEYEELMLAHFLDESVQASDVAQAWYDALAAAAGKK